MSLAYTVNSLQLNITGRLGNGANGYTAIDDAFFTPTKCPTGETLHNCSRSVVNIFVNLQKL